MRILFFLDRELCSFISSFDQLRETIEDCQDPCDIGVEDFEIWDELELRGLIHKKKIIELSGDSDEAMGFNIFYVNVPEGYKYLVVKVENTSNSTSFDLDKMLKISMNNQVIISHIEGHTHYNDKQFVYKGMACFCMNCRRWLVMITKLKN